MNQGSVTGEKTGRLPVIDVAKGIGMLLVIYAHVNYTPGQLAYIYSFHMPLFFLLSGMMFDREKYGTFTAFMKRKVQTMVCPYLLFYLLSWIIMLAIDVLKAGISGELITEYFKYILQMFLSQGSAYVVNSPLWFVPCLLAVEMMYYFISRLKKPWGVAVCAVLVCFGWFLESEYMPVFGILPPWSLDSALFALGFFAIGHLSFTSVKGVIERLDESRYKYLISCVTVAVCALALLPFIYLNGKVSLGSKELNNGVLLYVSGIVGTAGVLALSVVLKNSRFLNFCGRSSFTIMSTHYIIRRVLTAALGITGIGMYDATDPVQTVIPFIIVTVCSIVSALLYGWIKKISIKTTEVCAK